MGGEDTEKGGNSRLSGISGFASLCQLLRKLSDLYGAPIGKYGTDLQIGANSLKVAG